MVNFNKIKIQQPNHIQNHRKEFITHGSRDIAHNINNFLTSVLDFADLILMEEQVDDMILKYVSEIKKSGIMAASLSQKIMIDSRDLVCIPEMVNLNSLVIENENMLRVILPENIKLNFNFDQNLDITKVDSEQIVQVIMNLIINARDSMPDGGKIIIKTENKFMDRSSCKFHREIIPGDYVMIMVSDSGSGMGSPPVSSDKSILVVEKNQSHRELISKVLLQQGYNVYQSGSYREALRTIKALKEIKIDLLISDIKMPGIEEQELAEFLQKENSNVKLLFTSGFTEDILVHYGILTKSVSFLSKPFSLSSIMSIFDNILK